MKSSLSLTALGLAAVLIGYSLPAIAGDGHDHGDAAPAATGTALPRFAAVSETFELVGVLDGKQVTLYLDRFADNAPVRGAQIELEIAGAKFKAEAHGDDAYEVVLKEVPKPGVLPITATVTAGTEVDLLAGELDRKSGSAGMPRPISICTRPPIPTSQRMSTPGRSSPDGLLAAWPCLRCWCSAGDA